MKENTHAQKKKIKKQKNKNNHRLRKVFDKAHYKVLSVFNSDAKHVEM